MQAPPLAESSIHIWHVSLEKQTRDTAVRSLLAPYAGCPASALRFAADANGKPFLPDCPDLAFNLSHSRKDLLLAVGKTGPLGIDIEYAIAPAPLEAAAVAFSPAEQHTLAALEEPERSAAFYRIWTRKEALLKGRGEGFRTDPRRVTVLGEGPWDEWHLYDLPLPEPLAAALAATLPGAEIHYFPDS
jgi:4'-phosphopantetheinyl transferase